MGIMYFLFGCPVAGMLDLMFSEKGIWARSLVIVGYILWPIVFLYFMYLCDDRIYFSKEQSIGAI